MFEDNGVCVIEWPQFIQDILPLEYMEIYIHKNDDETRSLSFQAYGKKYENIIREIELC